MVIIKNERIENIPVLELFSKGKENEALPFVIFYHGWESRKERVLEYGYTLADQGFRVILPEAWNHGERAPLSNKERNALDFWEVVVQNVKEWPIISEYYIKQKKVRDDKVAVGGLSMGGITVSALLTQYETIHSAVVLMGSPAPTEFSKWLLKNYKIDGIALYDILDHNEVERKLSKLHTISLAKQPEKIANRPVYFWHGTEDPTVPIHLTENFIKNIQEEPYSQRLTFEKSEGVKHAVPREIILRTAEFFKRNF